MKKKVSLLSIALITTIIVFGQAPGIFNYQGVARNSVGNVLQNKSISLRLTIHDGSANGATVYQETRSLITNPFGLFNVQVGSAGASAVTGTITGVNWAVGNKFIQVEIDPDGGSSFINIGTAQLASVPYALNAGAATPTGAAGGDLLGSNYPNPVIAPLVVTTGKIADGAITTQKISFPLIKIQSDPGPLISMTNSGAGSGITGINTGTGNGGFFQINNPANVTDALSASTNGGATSWAIRATSTGLQGAGIFTLNNAATASNSLRVMTNGTGYAANITSSNATPLALRTQGGLQLTGIGEALNKVLTSDASGNANWQSLTSLGSVSGSGTLNFVSKWTPNGNTLGNSLLFDNGTNVAIGTTTPGNILFNIHATGAVFSGTKYTNAGTGQTNADGFFVGQNSPSLAAEALINNLENTDMLLATNNTVRMNIKANGNVGINTSSPGAKLHIVGDQINDNSNLTNAALFNNNNFSNSVATVKAFNGSTNVGAWGIHAISVTGTGYPGNSSPAAIVAETDNSIGLITSSFNNVAIRAGSVFNNAVYGESYGSFAGIYGVGLLSGGFGVVGTAAPGPGSAGYFSSPGGNALLTSGNVQLTGIGEANGKVLTSDATGNATWQTSASQSAGISLSTFPTGLAVPNNTVTPVTQWGTLNNEDGGSNYNFSTGQYTVPVTGVYQVNASIVWPAFVASDCRIQFFINGVFENESLNSSNQSVGFNSVRFNYARRFIAGQKLSISLLQNSGSTQTTYGAVAANSLSIQYLHK